MAFRKEEISERKTRMRKNHTLLHDSSGAASATADVELVRQAVGGTEAIPPYRRPTKLVLQLKFPLSR